MNPVTQAAASAGMDIFAMVRPELKQVEARLASELRSHWPKVDDILQYGCLLGGKRLRPALLLMVGRALGPLQQDHLLLATVIEMIHTATLVHDDVLDAAETRRHVATVNAKWDVSTSVLLGDFLFTHAFFLASTTDRAWACREIGRATNRVCEGELQQTHAQGRWDLSEQEYFEIIGGKTAALTECACRLGAQVSRSGKHDQQLVADCATYGRQLGLAFQIIDDLLDLSGHEEVVGKSLGTDLALGKSTLPWIRCRDRLDASLRRDYRQAWEARDRERLMGWLHETEGIESSRRTAEQLVRSAQQAVETLPESPIRDTLIQLAEFVLLRRH